MTRSDSFDLLRTWRLYTSMKMRSVSSTVWPWRSTSAIRVLTYFNAEIAFSSIIAFPPSAVSEPLRAIRSVERSTYDVLANIFTQTIAAQKKKWRTGTADWHSAPEVRLCSTIGQIPQVRLLGFR